MFRTRSAAEAQTHIRLSTPRRQPPRSWVALPESNNNSQASKSQTQRPLSENRKPLGRCSDHARTSSLGTGTALSLQKEPSRPLARLSSPLNNDDIQTGWPQARIAYGNSSNVIGGSRGRRGHEGDRHLSSSIYLCIHQR